MGLWALEFLFHIPVAQYGAVPEDMVLPYDAVPHMPEERQRGVGGMDMHGAAQLRFKRPEQQLADTVPDLVMGDIEPVDIVPADIRIPEANEVPILYRQQRVCPSKLLAP